MSSTGNNKEEQVIVVAKYDYVAQGSQELELRKNEKLVLLDDSKQWWKVLNSKGQSGFVPSNYVKKEKPSLFDSIKKRVRSSSNSKKNSSPFGSPKAIDININGSPTQSLNSHHQHTNGHSKSTLSSQSFSGPHGQAAAANYPHQTINHYVNDGVSVVDNGSVHEEPKRQQPSQITALVKYKYEAQQSDELSLVKGARVIVLEKSSDGWWKGDLNGVIGEHYLKWLFIPLLYQLLH